jgi:hypothetical protein
MKSRAATPASASPRLRWAYALFAAFFAAGTLRIFLLLLPQAFIRSAMVAEDVVDGTPPWRIFQNRVLGPWLVHGVHVVTHLPLAQAYAAFALITMFAAGLTVLVLTARLKDPSRPPLASFLLFQVGFVLLLPCIWLYVWDLLALILFTVFNYFVLRGAGRASFAVLFAIAILNHEIALAIAGWMVLDPIWKYFSAGPRGKRVFDRATFLLGLALIALGAGLIATLRRVLLVRLSEPPEAPDVLAPHWGDFHFALARNLDSLAKSFTFSPEQGYQFVVPLFIVGVLILAVMLARSDPARFGALAVMTILMVASFVCFGLVLETRVLMPLVPFVAMHGWAVARGRVSESAPP